jgi:DNA polymerase III sliding clamp (beta) subunit (PCNA family)
MNESRLFKFDKSDPHVHGILFVSKAIRKPEKYMGPHVMEKISFDGKRFISTDGRRLHLYTPDTISLPAGLYTVEKKTKNSIHLSCEENEKEVFADYPDIDRVIPEKKTVTKFCSTDFSMKYAQALRQQGEGTLNFNFFKDACSSDQIIEFQTGEANSVVSLYGPNLLVLIMPMRQPHPGE